MPTADRLSLELRISELESFLEKAGMGEIEADRFGQNRHFIELME